MVFDAGQPIAFLLTCKEQGEGEAGKHTPGCLKSRIAANGFRRLVANKLAGSGQSFVDLVVAERLHPSWLA